MKRCDTVFNCMLEIFTAKLRGRVAETAFSALHHFSLVIKEGILTLINKIY